MLTPGVLLYSERGVSTSIGVVNDSIERLVDPLPEEHSGSGPKTEQSSHAHHHL